MNKNLYYIIAGEPSGDLHGASLINEMKSLNSQISFKGLGGPLMQKAGLKTSINFQRLSVMGFWEVLKDIRFFLHLKKDILKSISESKPKKIILIDYPGFNLSLAKSLKSILDVPIIYYISPQVWAWKENRVKIIKDCVDQMLCIFPFEENWFQQKGVKAKYVGHPFSQLEKANKNSRLEFYKKHQIDPSAKILALMPGSRQIEVNRHLKTMLESAKIICEKNNIVPVIGLAPDISLPKIENEFIKIEKENPINVLKNSHVSILSSGTISLEAGLYEIPSIVIYKMNLISWFIAKSLVKVKYVSMTNILLEREIFKEYLQNEIDSKSIAEQILKFINNNKNETLGYLKELKKIIGKKKPNIEAAKIILGTIN